MTCFAHRHDPAVVTGAAGGIGRWIALGLARAGHPLVLVVRDETRAAAARAWIAGQVDGARVETVCADLASPAAVRAAGAEIARRHPRLGLLVNNAGVFLHRRQVTADGRDAVLAINHLAPHVLTDALVPALLAGAPSRIVNVGSSTSDRARIDPEDLEFRHRRWGYVKAYGQSKLALMMASFARAERLAGSGVTVNVVHPGTVATGIVRADGVIGLAWRGMAPFLLTEAQGAATPLHACLAPEIATASGLYLKASRPATPNRLARDPALVARLWRATELLAAA